MYVVKGLGQINRRPGVYTQTVLPPTQPTINQAATSSMIQSGARVSIPGTPPISQPLPSPIYPTTPTYDAQTTILPWYKQPVILIGLAVAGLIGYALFKKG